MTATAAKIAVQLEAQSAELRTGFQQATRSIQKLDNRVGSIASGFSKATLAIGAVVAAFKSMQTVVAQVNSAWQELSNNVDQAAKIGGTVEELEFLQFGAQRMGIEAGKLNTGLQRFTRRLSEAANGTGELKGALVELGLDAKRLENLTPAAAFQEFTQALSGVENQADRVRLGMKAFDVEGVALIEFANLGVDGLNDLENSFNELGGSAAHNAQALKEAEIAIGDMSRAWKLFLAQVAQFVAPVLEGIAKALSRIIGFFNRLTGRTRKIDVVEELTDDERELDKAAVGAAEAIEKQNKALEEQNKLIDQLKSRAEVITNSLKTPAERARDAVAELNNLFDRGLISVETYKRGVDKAAESVRGVVEAVASIVGGPGIATVASGGFSALQDIRRERKKSEQIERDQLAEARRIRELMERLDVRAVNI